MSTLEYDSGVDATDLFAGGGGSAVGLAQAGVPVKQAANHWRRAVDTHQTNHPEAKHDCADVSQVHPGRYRRTAIAWISPDCTSHTGASSAKGDASQDTSDGSSLPEDPHERSRATMWDVVRFAEWHKYDAMIVENVREVPQKWGPFRAWVMALDSIGYEGQHVWASSAHLSAGGDPAWTNRNRWYYVLNRKGAPRPDIAKWTSPTDTCTACGHTAQLVKAWKRPDGNELGGVYNTQYVWRCAACTSRVHPTIKPVREIVDWSDLGSGVFERSPQLVANTMRKIRHGLPRHADERGMAMPFIVELRGGGSMHRSINDPLATITAKGNHHALFVPPGYDPVANRGSVPVERVRLEEASYRMLTAQERKIATTFPASYILLGPDEDKVAMIGNAVTPNAARALGGAVVESLTGTSHLDRLTLAA